MPSGNHTIRTYINKTENSVTFKIKIGYYLDLLYVTNNETAW